MKEGSKRGFWNGLPFEIFTAGYNYENPKLSPNGKFVSYTMSNENGPHLYLYEISTSQHFQLTSEYSLSTGTEYGGETYCWSDDSLFLFYSSKGTLYRVPTDGGESTKLSGYGKQFSPSTNNNNLIFSVEHEEHMSLGVLTIEEEMEKNWPRRIPITESFIYDSIFHPTNGSILSHIWSYPNMSWNGSKIELLRPVKSDYSEIERIIIAGSETIATSQPRFSPNGDKISFLCEKNGWLNLWIADGDGSNPQPLVEEEHEHAYSTWVTGGSNHVWISNEQIVFTRNTEGFMSLLLVNINSKETKTLDLPEGIYAKLQSDGKYLLCFFTDHETRGKILLIDITDIENGIKEQNVSVITNSGVKLSEKITSQLTRPQKITFPTSDGLQSHGLLFANNDNQGNLQNAPVIINVHGGPTGMATNSFNRNAQYYASRGYAYFELNYRGSIGFGKEYRQKLNGNWGIYDVNDSTDALEYLSKEGLADKKKSIIMGGSAGGFTVLMTMAMKPGIFTVGVDLFGVSDNFLLAEETHYLEKFYSDSLVGTLPEDADKYFSLSPIFHADKIVDPLLILQGEDDPVVLKNQSELIRDKVKGPVEYKVYEGEGHGFRKISSLQDMFVRIEKFVKKYALYSKND
ncbi:MAG: S9 family peptidase [Candidatus Heimdallarchaeota archaeon]|nr:S9 family peptidase [Candidatus Heimdallarchaeota archaeon]